MMRFLMYLFVLAMWLSPCKMDVNHAQDMHVFFLLSPGKVLKQQQASAKASHCCWRAPPVKLRLPEAFRSWFP